MLKCVMSYKGGNMKRKINAILKPYSGLNERFTQIANTMITYIEDPYTLKVYMYLCMRYNVKYDYSFPSINVISNECKISPRKVNYAIKCLTEEGFILKGKFKEANQYCSNIYYIRYLYIDNKEKEKEIMSILPEEEIKEIEIDVPDELSDEPF